MKLSPWTLGLITFTILAMVVENSYLASVNTSQQHTIRQYMGLEAGPDETPRAPVMPPYVPSPALRTT